VKFTILVVMCNLTVARQAIKLRWAKRYLRQRGIIQPRVQIGALYVPPPKLQQEITREMSIVQEVLLNDRVRGPRSG
jgi:predicted transcriptional regulator